MPSITGIAPEGLLFLLMPGDRLDVGSSRDLAAALGFAAVGLLLTALALIVGLPVG